MKFIDQANISVRAGSGGKGRVSFRHEKYIDRGGPDGGDGGNGGSVILVASRNQNTLVSFRYQRELLAEDGQAGDKVKRHGRSGKDLRVAVPVGTVVYGQEGQIMADLTYDAQEAVIAEGGRGGFGNAHFISSVRQAPAFAENGEAGEAYELKLELKLIADVGLVGLPNAGKSTLLSVISNARPEIADYPFTTLTPNLGMVDIDSQHSLLFADIPGLIEGAAEGKGLGDEFLRHVERTAVLIHLIDVSSDDVIRDYQTIQHELTTYKVNLTDKPQIVALSKTDTVLPEMVIDAEKSLMKILPKDVGLLTISSQAHMHLKELLFAVQAAVTTVRTRQDAEAPVEATIPVLKLKSQQIWRASKVDGNYVVSGSKIERFAVRTDFSNPDAVQRLRVIMKKQGIVHELSRLGIKPGDTVRVGGNTFEY